MGPSKCTRLLWHQNLGQTPSCHLPSHHNEEYLEGYMEGKGEGEEGKVREGKGKASEGKEGKEREGKDGQRGEET